MCLTTPLICFRCSVEMGRLTRERLIRIQQPTWKNKQRSSCVYSSRSRWWDSESRPSRYPCELSTLIPCFPMIDPCRDSMAEGHQQVPGCVCSRDPAEMRLTRQMVCPHRRNSHVYHLPHQTVGRGACRCLAYKSLYSPECGAAAEIRRCSTSTNGPIAVDAVCPCHSHSAILVLQGNRRMHLATVSMRRIWT
jgi:hypothetical protein